MSLASIASRLVSGSKQAPEPLRRKWANVTRRSYLLKFPWLPTGHNFPVLRVRLQEPCGLAKASQCQGTEARSSFPLRSDNQLSSGSEPPGSLLTVETRYALVTIRQREATADTGRLLERCLVFTKINKCQAELQVMGERWLPLELQLPQ